MIGVNPKRREFVLRVAEAKRYEAMRGKVRIPLRVMNYINVEPGDVVEITGRRLTVAIAWPAHTEDEGNDIIRMDGIIRKNAGVGIGEKVIVRKASIKPALHIKLAPGTSTLEISSSENSVRTLKRRLIDYPLVEGDVVPLQVLNRPILLYVVQTRPSGPVIITDETAITIIERSPTLLKLPKVTYEDIGGMKHIIERVRELIELPLKHPELFRKLGIDPPKGVLLIGPPGVGKTLLAKAVATESGANFIAVKGPEILSKWVGESEKAVREIFKKARTYAPAVVFFDEIDAIAPTRGLYADSRVTERVVSQLLTEMDSIEKLSNVIVIAATNRPDLVDPALLRPGRLEKIVYVAPPDRRARLEILRIHTKRMPLAKDVDLEEIAEQTDGYSGADLAALVREAAMNALREDLNISKVNMRHFRAAMDTIGPSITKEMIKFYEDWGRKARQRLPRTLTHPYNI